MSGMSILVDVFIWRSSAMLFTYLILRVTSGIKRWSSKWTAPRLTKRSEKLDRGLPGLHLSKSRFFMTISWPSLSVSTYSYLIKRGPRGVVVIVSSGFVGRNLSTLWGWGLSWRCFPISINHSFTGELKCRFPILCFNTNLLKPDELVHLLISS